MILSAGDVLHQRYRIVRLLEQGGFGAVYRAWDTVLGHSCAVKENLDTAPDAQRQFEREAKILAGLAHPNLPRVIDHFFVPNQGQYLVMDLVEGQDLQAMLEERGGPLPEEQVLGWVGQVCDALTYLHSQNPPVIHRDIKPANVRITPAGRAMLVDFGIAKTYDAAIKTTVGARAVTPGYSPYEQYGRGTTDARTDIYALGATLYTLLSGQEPPESIQRVVRDPLVQPDVLNVSISSETAAAVLRAMQMDAEQRFQSAEEMKAALLQGSHLASAPGLVLPQSPAPARPLPWLWIGIVIGLTVTFVLVGLFLSGDLPWIGAGQATQAALMNTPPSPPASSSPVGQGSALPALLTLPPSPAPTATEVPQPTPLPLVYTVKPGDTCSEIALKFGVSVQKIAQLNNLPGGCEKILAGDKLLISDSAIQSVGAAQQTRPNRVSDVDHMEMAYIPAGIFLMGTAEMEANANERPQRVISVDAFWMDRTEVTNVMYALCVKAQVCQAPEKPGSKTRLLYFGDPDYLNYPVLFVSWQDASDYCKWAGRRLPTEAEWEKAARGVDGQTYPWGEAAPERTLLNFNNQVGDTTPAGSYPDGASPYGLLDMAGNAAEWVNDWYSADYYALGDAVNPLGPPTGEFRGLRGGSWFNPQRVVRAAFRFWNLPDRGYDIGGFRCAASP